jgi:hypothetical protein
MPLHDRCGKRWKPRRRLPVYFIPVIVTILVGLVVLPVLSYTNSRGLWHIGRFNVELRRWLDSNCTASYLGQPVEYPIVGNESCHTWEDDISFSSIDLRWVVHWYPFEWPSSFGNCTINMFADMTCTDLVRRIPHVSGLGLAMLSSQS